MRVTVVHNRPVLADAHPAAASEHEILDVVRSVTDSLSRAGLHVSRLEIGRDLGELGRALREQRPDVVFNLFEGFADDPPSEACMAASLERLGIPITGCSASSLAAAGDKPRAKTILQRAGIPTPRFLVVGAGTKPSWDLGWPAIVKPAWQDASVGIGPSSVVSDRVALERRVAEVLRDYGPPALVEQFIGGREFSAALIESTELRVLPLLEFEFLEGPALPWPILTYDAKWKPESAEYLASPATYAAEVSAPLRSAIDDLARRAFRALGCRDCARVDLRLDARGTPQVLEVNPNPDLSPAACFAGALAAGGLSHERFVVELAEAALARGGRPTRHARNPAGGSTDSRRARRRIAP